MLPGADTSLYSRTALGRRGDDVASDGGAGSLVREYLWRVFHLEQMDLEYTYSQMINLLRAPSEVYKSTKIRKQIKNQWARDDPAFVVILVLFIVLASLAYSAAFGVSSFFHWLRVVLGSVLIEFLGVGFLVATSGRWLANRYMRLRRVHSVDQEVEWLYAFDVHCNGFFPLFVLLFVGQYFLSPLLMGNGFVSVFLANSLYALAFSYYHYVSFLGYSALPFLHNTQKFLYPIGVILVVYVLSLIFRFNVFKFMISLYFGSHPAPLSAAAPVLSSVASIAGRGASARSAANATAA